MGFSLFTKMRSPLEPLTNRTHTMFCLQCLLLRWWVQPSLGVPLITATTAVVLPSGGSEAVGVLCLICISLPWLDYITVTSSALLSVEGLVNVAGPLGVTGLLNVEDLQEIAGSLRVARLLIIVESRSIAGSLSITGPATS